MRRHRSPTVFWMTTRGHCLQFPQLRENRCFQKPKTCNRQITKTIHLHWGALCQESPRKSCRQSSYRRCERQCEWSPSCRRSASYLWRLLWPSDYRDPSDGQTGVILRVLLQDILWPNKGVILARSRGEVPEGVEDCTQPKKALYWVNNHLHTQ